MKNELIPLVGTHIEVVTDRTTVMGKTVIYQGVNP